MSLAHMLFSFHGRTRRLRYWLLTLALVVVQLSGMAFLEPSLFSEMPPASSPSSVTLLSLVLLYPALAVTVRRLNDINGSPLWAYALTGVSATLTLGDAFGLLDGSGAMSLALTGVLVIEGGVAIIIGCVRSFDGDTVQGRAPCALPV